MVNTAKRMIEKVLATQWGRVTATLLVMVIFASLGSWLLSSSHADTTTASVETEDGASTCANTVNDTTASSGQGIKFAGTGCNNDTSDPTNLDETGSAIPNTNYAIPASGTVIFLATTGSDSNPGTLAAPVASLTKAINLATSNNTVDGSTVVVRGGVYRDWYTNGSNYATVTKTLTIQAYPHEQVWFDGTNVEPTGNWTSDGAGHWSMTWSTPTFCNGGYYNLAYNAQSGSTTNPGSNNGPCTHYDMIGNSAHSAAADPQMVFKNGTYVPEVSSLSAVTASNFFYDEDLANKTGTLYLGFNPNGNTVEVAARPIALNMSGAGSKVLGIGFRRYATNEYDNTTKSALRIAGDNSVIENSVLTGNAGGALYVGSVKGMVNHVVMANNGFTAMNSNGHEHSDLNNTNGTVDGLVVQNSVVNDNNDEYFGSAPCSVSCAMAGIKYGHMEGFTVKHNIFEYNRGTAAGFWCDLACSNGVVVDNVSHDNEGEGLFYEVSNNGIFASNLVYNNVGYGIRISSANTKVYNNTIVNNTKYGGLWVYDDARSFNYAGWTDVGPDTVNIAFVNNIVEDTKGSNTILRAQAAGTGQTNTTTSQFFNAFDYNAYSRTTSSQDVMRWIVYNNSETTYRSLPTFVSGTGLDMHSTDVVTTADQFFTNIAANDYTVKAGTAPSQSGTTIPADVAAAMGVSTAAGQNKGAFNWPGK